MSDNGDNGDEARRPYHPPETVELARECWTYLDGRNAKAVALRLQRDHGLDVSHDAVKKWSSRHGWAERAAADVAAIVPALRQDVATELVLASDDAKRVVRGILQRHNDGDEITKSDDIAAKIAFGVLDRVGFGPSNAATSGGSSDARAIPPTSSGKVSPELRRRLAAKLGLSDDDDG